MPLPAATIPIEPIAGPSKRAYVIRLPQDTLDALQDAQDGEAKVWMDAGVLKIDVPGNSIPLEAHTVEPSEIHLLSSDPSGLRRLAIASTRLSVPLSSRSASKAGEKLKQSIAALDDAKSARAAAVAGQKAAPKPDKLPTSLPVTAPMGRVQSSPAATVGAGSGPVIPLKTRVMQLLALGPITAPDLIEKVAGNEVDVMRVVNVVGRSAGTPPKFSLQPQQYAKIKIGAWKYTHREQLQIIGLARQAYDELGMASGTPERAELDRLEQEAQSGLSSVSETNGDVDMNGSSATAVHQVNGNGSTSSKASAGSGSAGGKSNGGRSGSPSASSSTSSRTSANANNHEHPPPRPSTPMSTSTSPEKSKKGSSKTPKTLIGKAKAKHLAEQKRASSLPNIKDAGAAAIGGGQVPLPSPQRVPAAESKAGKHGTPLPADSVPSPKRKQSPMSVDGEPKRKVKPKKRPAPDYSSSSGSEKEERGRGRPPGPKVTSSSTSPDKPQTPPEPELNGHRILPDIKKRSKTRTEEERKRDRYETLYARYSELTRRLVGVHRGMEELEEGEDVAMGDTEVRDLVKEWKGLHEQLSELRSWFVES